jgi:hypothetical protein
MCMTHREVCFKSVVFLGTVNVDGLRCITFVWLACFGTIGWLCLWVNFIEVVTGHRVAPKTDRVVCESARR